MTTQSEERWKVIFRGRVQGVGFRYVARREALSLSLSGSVENLTDGSVRLIAQGSVSSLRALILRMKSQDFIHVESFDIEKQDLDETQSGAPKTFKIIY